MASPKATRISEEQRSLLRDRLLASIEGDNLKWFKSWMSPEPPQNYESGRWYTGVNRGLLSFLQLYHGYKDPRWIPTWRLKEIAPADGSWNWQGQHASYIELWQEGRKQITDKDGEPVLNEDGKPILRRYMYLANVIPVMNMSQIQGAPAYQPRLIHNQDTKEESYVTADCIINDYLPDQAVGYTESAANDTAAWSPTKHCIYMPARELFMSAESFTSTLMHETIHSTGPEFNRDQQGFFGSSSYAREELVAEFGSLFLAQNFGIEYCGAEFDNHVAYLQHWKQRVKEKDGPDFIMKAITDAELAARHVWEIATKNTKLPEDYEEDSNGK